ncbi:hypothetical protein [Thermococcus stetteri]|uniref:hypothetical protein n=1 Tax=Thermococcus stetteri TaxID=49900 RepID=UPI001AE1029C|nr:hypothetical protein [Thermococcus stetteri]MBP1911072.1 hypothetical protein [Thermococcus stetteri]
MKPKTALQIVEWTSFPLLLFVGLMIVSGYALTSVNAQRASLFLDFTRAIYIHLGRFFRLSLISLFLLHSYGGTVLFVRRRVRNEKIGALIEYSVLAFLIYVLWVAIMAELGG